MMSLRRPRGLRSGRFIPTRLITLNALLLAASLLLGADIVWELMRPLPSERAPRGSAPTAAAPTEPTVSPSVISSSLIASRNLFSPTRGESTSAPVTAAAPLMQPSLHGVVLAPDSALAFLEDPATKRVTGYRIGDAIAGGIIRVIDAEHIVIDRHGAPLDIRLHDPLRSRPAVAAASGASHAAQAADRLAQAPTSEPLAFTPEVSARPSPVIGPRMLPATRGFRSPF